MLNLKLKTKRLNLVSTSKELISAFLERKLTNYYDWFGDEKVNEFNSHGLFPQSQKELTDFFNRCENDKSLSSFMIIDKATNKHIGQCSLQRIDYINRSAEFAIVIGELDYHGKGIATECLQKLFEHGFLKLGLNRIWSGTSILNIGMQKVFEKCGFKQEGIYRQAQFLNGSLKDIICYALLRSEWDVHKVKEIENEK